MPELETLTLALAAYLATGILLTEILQRLVKVPFETWLAYWLCAMSWPFVLSLILIATVVAIFKGPGQN